MITVIAFKLILNILFLKNDRLFSVVLFNLIGFSIFNTKISLVAGALMYLNEATLLNNIKIRYKNDKIYVSILKVLF